MSYQKPGIEIKQVQKSVSPILDTPDLGACLVGHSYWWQDPTWEQTGSTEKYSIATATYSGVSLTVALSGINSIHYDVSLKPDLTVVDLVGSSGENGGLVFHLTYGNQFSVSNNSITISGNAQAYNGAGTLTTLSSGKYQVKVGYRAAMPTGSGVNTIATTADIESTLGANVSWNPLGYAASICAAESGAVFQTLGLDYDITSSDNTDIKNAIDDNLELIETYVVAPIIHGLSLGNLKSHVETLSAPEGKKERIGIASVSNASLYGARLTTLTSSAKAIAAATIRDNNSAIQSKRVFSLHPEVIFVKESRHLSTIKPSWIHSSFNVLETDLNFNTYGPFAKLASPATVGGKTYATGTEITEAVWTELVKYNITDGDGYNLTVWAPVPGFYLAAAVAGQIISLSPEQPLTNVPMGFTAMTYGGTEVFSETLLNTMASGGTYILVQDTKTGPIYSRHQRSTDVTSVAKSELSITKSIDYCAKFIRNALKPYIGRNVITPEFIALVNAIINGIGKKLIVAGIIADLRINSVGVEDSAPDTINIELEIKPLYPANYIKITLLF